jgi:hypothetical protein
MGLMFAENAYLDDSWNRLDGFLVLISVVDFILARTQVDAGPIMRVLKIMRILRALRPLRVINKAPPLHLPPRAPSPGRQKNSPRGFGEAPKLKRIVTCMMESMVHPPPNPDIPASIWMTPAVPSP